MNMMVIFDVIVVLFGVYMVASAFKMNRSGEISSMLVSKEELGKCRDKAAFIGNIYRKEAAFGVIMALVGILNLVDALVISIKYATIAEMLVFLFAFLWFNRELRDARTDYFY